MEKLRVAVAGASGIGKHHAKWYHMAGCEVVGFLGSSQESCEATAEILKELFPFEGRGYRDWESLLDEEEPDLVDICVPNHLHLECALKALEKGCHVLCEKPLVWEQGEALDLLLERARGVVEVARKNGLKFGMCTQYAASLPHYAQLYEPACGELQEVTSFFAEMETVARGRRRSAAEVWVDMGPHPLSLLVAWMPDGAIAADSLQVEFKERKARASFDFVVGERSCRSEIIVCDREEGKPVRRFGVNGFVVDCQGRNDDQGHFRSLLSRGSAEVMGEDFMSLLISQFVQAVRDPQKPPLATGETGLRNLELQIQILQKADS